MTLPQSRFYILAGPPGAGKTTLLHSLSGRLNTVPEYARRVLAHERKTGGRATGDQDPALFVERMLDMAISDFEAADGLTLFDRGLPDLLAFCAHYRIPDDAVRDAVATRRYQTDVFFLPAWEDIYTTDDERILDFAGARAFGALIRTAYQQSGYNLIQVPTASPQARAAFVSDRIAL
ncbi:MAG: ATP-binding protein [Hyphomonadaceae bacterium]|nr:ATP-binding protein [Hyphomonadaceae bacterium]